ncbi:MAG: cobalt ECF transporter T component CbiQ [Deltaproteobacteria bacterium]|nr:cobalt ECF transporter T component CbiQ [Deltaproteobacteria bacterium]
MKGPGASLAALRDLDALSARDLPLARLDPRAPLLVTLLLSVLVASFPRGEVLALVPFLLWPATIASLAAVPVRPFFRALLVPLPFVLLAALPALFVESGPAGRAIAASILLRFLLTVTSTLLLPAVWGIPALAWAMQKLGAPAVLVTQLLVLWRYLFVLGEEAVRMDRARTMRSFGRRGRELALAGPFLGTLLLRSQDRAERIDRALRARAFTGSFPALRPWRFGAVGASFLLFWTAALAFFRVVNVPEALGRLLAGGA